MHLHSRNPHALPTTFESFAVDFTGDGHVDFWSEDALDALASAANYLLKSGWRYGEAWGIEVLLPEKIDYGMLHRQPMILQHVRF
jgi:membrane-bound lytic murein transglycosylase B